MSAPRKVRIEFWQCPDDGRVAMSPEAIRLTVFPPLCPVCGRRRITGPVDVQWEPGTEEAK